MTAAPILDPAAAALDQGVAHISETCCDPHQRTLCGQEISRSAWRQVPSPELEACVVCAELHRLLRYCSRCGRRLR